MLILLQGQCVYRYMFPNVEEGGLSCNFNVAQNMQEKPSYLLKLLQRLLDKGFRQIMLKAYLVAKKLSTIHGITCFKLHFLYLDLYAFYFCFNMRSCFKLCFLSFVSSYAPFRFILYCFKHV